MWTSSAPALSEEPASSEEPWAAAKRETPAQDRKTAEAPEGQAQPVALSPGVQEAVPASALAEDPP